MTTLKTQTEQTLSDLMKDLVRLGNRHIKTEGTTLDELISLCEGLRNIHKAEYHDIDPLPPFENAMKITLHFLYGMRELYSDASTIKTLETNPSCLHFHEQAKRIMNGCPTDADVEEIGSAELKHIMCVK